MFSLRLCALNWHNQHLTCCCLTSMPERKSYAWGICMRERDCPALPGSTVLLWEQILCLGLQEWLMHLPGLISPAAGHVPPGMWVATARGDFGLISQMYRFMVCGLFFIAGYDMCCRWDKNIFRASVRDGRGSNVWYFLGMWSKFLSLQILNRDLAYHTCPVTCR